MTPFAHLHVHSRYTLLGGTASVEELAARAAADGLTHLALTDTNALYGAVAFARACHAAGVQPITGMAVTVALPDDLREQMGDAQPPGLLVLLATGPVGYRSLCRLSSLSRAALTARPAPRRDSAWTTCARTPRGCSAWTAGARAGSSGCCTPRTGRPRTASPGNSPVSTAPRTPSSVSNCIPLPTSPSSA